MTKQKYLYKFFYQECINGRGGSSKIQILPTNESHMQFEFLSIDNTFLGKIKTE